MVETLGPKLIRKLMSLCPLFKASELSELQDFHSRVRSHTQEDWSSGKYSALWKKTTFSISSGASKQRSGLCLRRKASRPGQLCVRGGLQPRGPMTLWTESPGAKVYRAWVMPKPGLEPDLSQSEVQGRETPRPGLLFRKTPGWLKPNPRRKTGGKRRCHL